MGQAFNIFTKKPVSTGENFNNVNMSSGGGGNNMESRIAKLESDVDYIKTTLSDIKEDTREIKRDARNDFRILFGAIIAVALGLAGLVSKGFGWI